MGITSYAFDFNPIPRQIMQSCLWTQPRPDKHASLIAWEESWDHDLTRLFDAVSKNVDSVYTPMRIDSLLPPSGEALVQLDLQHKLICELQHDLAKTAALRFSEDDFEQEWQSATSERRRDVVLQGIYRTMCIPDMEERRKWCPESTMRHLTSDGGQTYIRMLKSLLPSSLGAPIVEPIIIPHPLFTIPPSKIDRTVYQVTHRMYSSNRTYCITTIIWNILLTFHDVSEPQVAIKVPRASSKHIAAVSAASPYPDRMRQALEQANEEQKGLAYACWMCGKNPNLHAVKLKACGRCLGIGRKIWYCSRECQTNSWTSGIPRPHKAICGKRLSDTDDHVSSSVGDTSTVSDSNPQGKTSFKPSPALLRQMSVLEKMDRNPDYIIFLPKMEVGLGITPTETKALFRMLRQRAFLTGDTDALLVMYSMLKECSEIYGIPKDTIRQQLLDEYGVDVENTARNMGPRSTPLDADELQTVITAFRGL